MTDIKSLAAEITEYRAQLLKEALKDVSKFEMCSFFDSSISAEQNKEAHLQYYRRLIKSRLAQIGELVMLELEQETSNE